MTISTSFGLVLLFVASWLVFGLEYGSDPGTSAFGQGVRGPPYRNRTGPVHRAPLTDGSHAMIPNKVSESRASQVLQRKHLRPGLSEARLRNLKGAKADCE